VNLEQKLLCLAESYEDLAKYCKDKKPLTEWLDGNYRGMAEVYERTAAKIRRILKEEGEEGECLNGLKMKSSTMRRG